MELNIKITTSDSCKVTIQDLSTYLPEDSTILAKHEFKYSDTLSIDVLQHNKSPQETVYITHAFNKHTTKNSTTFSIDFDGWFTLTHIVLPTKEWFDTQLSILEQPEGLEEQEASALGMYDIVYYSDGQYIYKYVDGVSKEVPLSEIVEFNPINTTLLKTEKDYVSICLLRKCYINLCQQIFNGRGFSACLNNNKVDSELTFKRDLVWMAINVVKYLTECEQLAEAERILESIQGCNGLCNSSNMTSSINGCGCSK